MLTSLLIIALAQPGLARFEPRRNTDSFAFFEFAPSGGTGMGAACACTTPTGAKGEALTFTRASSGTCLVGNTTSGIANGDMVTCTSNQPRVMPGGDGSGGNGLLVEGTKTNDLLRSEEFENAAWSNQVFGVIAIIVTPNVAVAPNGTLTADRLQIPAATSAQYSLRFQTVAGASRVGSVFAKGNAESGTLYIMQAGTTVTCSLCAYNPTTWTRCETSGTSTSQTAFNIGTDPLDCGGGNQPAKDVFVADAQSEVGAFASSYIATTAVAVTRAVDSAYFALTWPVAPGWSIATSYLAPSASPVNSALIGGTFYVNATNLYEGYFENDSTKKLFSYVDIAGVNKLNASCSQAITLSALNRLSFSYSGGTVGDVCVNGTCTATTPTSYTLLSGAVRYYVGAFASANYESDGVTKRVCADPSGARCR